jgi:hypothetical protein
MTAVRDEFALLREQIYQRRSRERRSDRAGGTMSAPSPLSIPTVFRPVATSAQRTPTGLRVV